MRLYAFLMLPVLIGCSAGTAPTPDPVANLQPEQLTTVEGFLDKLAKQGESNEAKSLANAKKDISELNKVDQAHERKLLLMAQEIDLTDLKKAYTELGHVKGFSPQTPAGRYFAQRVVVHTYKLPAFKSLVRWGWENVLDKKQQKFDVIADWLANYNGDIEHRSALPELVDSLRSGKRPSDDALKLYSAVFVAERLPHGW